MKIRFNIQTIDDLKGELEQAALTERALPATANLRAKSTWPDFLRDPEELKQTITDKPLFTPSQEDFGKWEEICLNWINFFSEAERKREWAVIWLKSCKVPSKTISKKTGMSRTKAWYCYNRGLNKLFACLTNKKVTTSKIRNSKSKISGYTVDLATIKEAVERLENKLKNNKNT